VENTIKINTQSIPTHIAHTLCRPLVGMVQSAYKDADFVAKYIEFHKNKYGELPSNYEELQKVIVQSQT